MFDLNRGTSLKVWSTGVKNSQLTLLCKWISVYGVQYILHGLLSVAGTTNSLLVPALVTIFQHTKVTKSQPY